MPRPDLEPGWLARVEAAYDSSPHVPAFAREGGPRRILLEVWLSGIWLREQLVGLGASEDQRAAICFAHGQRSFGHDPWTVVAFAVDEYRRGLAATPGLELGRDLLSGRAPRLSRVAGTS